MKHFDIGLQKTNLVKVSQLEKKEFPRLKSSYNLINNLFGNGWREGSVIQTTGYRGCGKTTFWLQILDDFSKEYSTAYVSNEESQDQLQEKCIRLNVNSVEIGYMSSLEDILEVIRSYKIVVIDSFQGIACNSEKEAIQKIVSEAKKHNTCVAIIVHMTKGLREKGGSEIPHLCDQTIKLMEANPDVFGMEGKTIIINSDKNRNGRTGYWIVSCGSVGYDFENPWDEYPVEMIEKNSIKKD
jgi:DNA repair protein RadA/Sms